MGLVSGVGVNWRGPADIKQTFASASFLANNRVVFNIGGNNYRLIVEVSYKRHLIFVRFIGTHAEYDKIDAVTVKDF